MADHRIRTGGCLCGTIRYETQGEPILRGTCMCRNCQRWFGPAAGMGVQFLTADIRFTSGAPKVYRSSAIFERSFCEACGSPLMTRYVVPPYGPDRAMIPVGTFDDPADFAGPEFYFGIESHLDKWLRLDEDLPRINCDEDRGLAKAWAEVERDRH